ncbi:MAG: WecB/TagA/CpsF family glycosyltransferase [Armatimonadetes bacterium]|nr:WecB/TagA/CpsF family glycosyltransferase [Armatimonadota bacterium]
MIRTQTPESRPTIGLLGARVSTLDMAGTLAAVEEMVAEGGPHMLVTADASGFVIARSDLELAAIYAGASLVTPDSQGVVWALNRKGAGVKARVSGVDLVAEICRMSANTGLRLFFLGAEPGVAETAAERLRLMFPGCHIVGTRHGYFPPDDDLIVAEEVARSKPDVLFVAMGIPRQEKFIAKTMEIVRAKLAMGVGGSLDVFSGRAKRAPKLVQALKSEWLWRLMLNPSKFSKVKTLPKFVRLVLREGR